MTRKALSNMSKEELIQEINVLGPWVHGYFKLDNGLVIEDHDHLQKQRLFAHKTYFSDIISDFYQTKSLSHKTICDIGCNTGYFLYELFKIFNFKVATGLEPRQSNLAKARFIAEYYQLPAEQYQLKKFDIMTKSSQLPNFDIVLLPGVLHHLDDHFHALSNLYKMTNELCIIDTIVLPDTINSQQHAKHLYLKDSIYQKIEQQFGFVGYKLETNRLDGSTIKTGIVTIPSTDAVLMMLKHVGFEQVEVYRSCEQLSQEEYNQNAHWQANHAIIVAHKKGKSQTTMPVPYDELLNHIEEEEFVTSIPLELIEPLYQLIEQPEALNEYSEDVKNSYHYSFFSLEKKGVDAFVRLENSIEDHKVFNLLKTLKYAPKNKIPFEYAKSCFHQARIDKALEIAHELITICNLDWRIVYKTYYLLARIYLMKGSLRKAKKYNNLSLRAFPDYSLALQLKKRIKSL